MAPGSDIWSEANQKRFLHIIIRNLGGSPASHFATIAEQMGPAYTLNAVQNKWKRMKAEFENELGGAAVPAGGATAAPAPATPKKAGRPKKAAAAKETPGAEGEEVEKEKPKRGRKRKADSASPAATIEKKAKSDDEEEGEIKEEPEAVAQLEDEEI